MARLKKSHGGVKMTLDHNEAEVLRDLVVQMREVVAGENAGDPALGRLYPPAYEGEQEQASYRDLTESELKSSKLHALDTMKQSLGESGRAAVTLARAEVDSWLTGLTDMRLVIGTRLDITEEKMNAPLDENDPEAPGLSILHWLGWLQQSLIEALTGVAPSTYEEEPP